MTRPPTPEYRARTIARYVFVKDRAVILGLPGLSVKASHEDALTEAIAAAIQQAVDAEREACARICDDERREYEASMREFDKRGDTRMGTNEARCAETAQLLAEAIRARGAKKEDEGNG